MYYKVFIPSKEPDGFDVTITVDADNWMSALSKGLERTGEGSDAARNVMCDIKDDNTFHVTDASTQRVFVLEEISEEEFQKSQDEVVDEEEEDEDDEVVSDVEAGEASTAPPDVEPLDDEDVEPLEDEEVDLEFEADGPADEAAEAGSAPDKTPDLPEIEEADEPNLDQKSTADDISVGSSTREQLQEKQEEEATVVEETRRRSDEHRADAIGRDTGQDDSVSETLIEDFFLEVQPIHEGDMSMEEVVDFVLDLVMDKIDAESGSILFADTSGRELYFAAARGPKSDEVMDFRVPMGEGIVGFCSREGVSLAIGDAQEDPRFYQEISDSIGYETHSLLCAPVQHEGRVYGAIELVNKERGSSFNSNEMNALSYVGRQLAEYVNRVVMSRESLDEGE